MTCESTVYLGKSHAGRSFRLSQQTSRQEAKDVNYQPLIVHDRVHPCPKRPHDGASHPPREIAVNHCWSPVKKSGAGARMHFNTLAVVVLRERDWREGKRHANGCVWLAIKKCQPRVRGFGQGGEREGACSHCTTQLHVEQRGNSMRP